MDVEIALSPGLNVSPHAFADAWNADPECQALGQVEVRKKGGTQFEPLTLAAFLAGVAGSVAASVISHLIIKALESKSPGQQLEVLEVARPTAVACSSSRLQRVDSLPGATAMTVIRIQEQKDREGANATVSFDDQGDYPATINNPFDEAAEQRLEWYFEEHLRFPFTEQVRASDAGKSLQTYGEALFKQVFADEAYGEYIGALEWRVWRSCASRSSAHLNSTTTLGGS